MFDQFIDYGGGGFHPAGNEVIINSEVWDLRNRRLLRSVPSLDQTVITFNDSGGVIYAILRRNLDAVNYSDITTIPLDRGIFEIMSGQEDGDDEDEMIESFSSGDDDNFRGDFKLHHLK
ncbi:DDB1- and CUL4-associated factor homolog 1 [Tanacetum coccineum]